MVPLSLVSLPLPAVSIRPSPST